jgi:hypothetical protein
MNTQLRIHLFFIISKYIIASFTLLYAVYLVVTDNAFQYVVFTSVKVIVDSQLTSGTLLFLFACLYFEYNKRQYV